jgi:hypothetical protein
MKQKLKKFEFNRRLWNFKCKDKICRNLKEHQKRKQ